MSITVNRNFCKSFKITASGSLAAFANQECSEVIVLPRATVLIFDYRNPSVGFQLLSGEKFTFRGLTNANQLSATGSGDIYYRTQFFSNLPGV